MTIDLTEIGEDGLPRWVQCGYCKEEWIDRREAHSWCRDWNCAMCDTCQQGSEMGAVVLRRFKVFHAKVDLGLPPLPPRA